MRKRKRLLTLLALLTAAAGAWAQATATTSATRSGSDNTYKVKMKEGTKDAAKWTIASDGNSTTGDQTEGLTVAPKKEVTLTYLGRLKVKSVTATHDGWDGDLSNIPASLIGSDGYTVTIPDGTTLTGRLDGRTNRYKIVIPDGATVTLADVDISGQSNENYKWAGINCEGNATIILADNTTNKVEGFYDNWPGIYVPGDKNDPSKNKTLIIKGGSDGSGELEANGRGNGAGIGGGNEIACGNIIIEGGNIKAKAGNNGAGIGSGNKSSCGNIIINGGNIKAEGDYNAAGIGSGHRSSCGNIIIEGGDITAESREQAAGIGSGCSSSCGDITITGGNVEAKSGNNASGIGSGFAGARCGDITITGGTVTSTGKSGSVGIGSGVEGCICGDITISGGTVTAFGDEYGSGIGCGDGSRCGNITITKDVTLVTATKGEDAPNSIGLSYNGYECRKVTIGCELDSEGKPKSGTGTVYYDVSSYENGGDVYLAQSPLTLVNLGKLTDHYEAPNGTTLFGTLKGSEQPYKVSIADGATVTLDGADIEGVDDYNCQWAGLTCAGNATIILNEGSENTVKGFHDIYPGVFVPDSKTLIIKSGTTDPGKLTASPFDGGTDYSYGAGIGGSFVDNCGAIEIQGGIITATGGKYAAGIGSGKNGIMGNITISGGDVTANGGRDAAGIGSGHLSYSNSSISITGGTVKATGGQGGAGIGSGNGKNDGNRIDYTNCGDITISGGTVTATGGDWAAGIGTGMICSQCGDIKITSGVDHVTAKMGEGADNSIGMGSGDPRDNNSCRSKTIEDSSKVTQE